MTVWHRDKDGDVLLARLRVTSPSGKELFVFQLPEQVLTTDVHRHNVGMGGFNLEETGEHRVVVEQRVGGAWREVRTLPFFVELVDTQPKKADPERGAA